MLSGGTMFTGTYPTPPSALRQTPPLKGEALLYYSLKALFVGMHKNSPTVTVHITQELCADFAGKLQNVLNDGQVVQKVCRAAF